MKFRKTTHDYVQFPPYHRFAENRPHSPKKIWRIVLVVTLSALTALCAYLMH